MRERFLGEFRIDVPSPAFFNDIAATSCTGIGYLTTTAYLADGASAQRRLYVMHLRRDGLDFATSVDGRTRYTHVVDPIPAGTFSVLTVFVSYPETFSEAAYEGLARAQAAVNEQHRLFARSRGYASPIVQFQFFNLVVDAWLIADPRDLASVSLALAPSDISTSEYDFVAVINIDPDTSEGGFARTGTPAPHFVYMGNYGHWTAPPTDHQLASIASAVYHHEVGHHWGWEHDWAPACGGPPPYAPFITAPVLFGWEDTDGDGIPEILDATPYGRVP